MNSNQLTTFNRYDESSDITRHLTTVLKYIIINFDIAL